MSNLMSSVALLFPAFLVKVQGSIPVQPDSSLGDWGIGVSVYSYDHSKSANVNFVWIDDFSRSGNS